MGPCHGSDLGSNPSLGAFPPLPVFSSHPTGNVILRLRRCGGMRLVLVAATVAILLCGLALVPIPASAGTESNPEIRDPPGDVTSDFTTPTSGALAKVLDVTAQWLSRDADGHLWAHTKLTSLAELADLQKMPAFSAQYAFVVQAGLTQGTLYQVHASIGGTEYGDPPAWRCAVEDRDTQAWTETLGYVDVPNGVIHVRLTDEAAKAIAAAGGSGSLSGQAWGSTDESGRPQSDDWTSGTLPYLLALDAVQASPDSTGLLPCGLASVAPLPPVPATPGNSDLGDVQVPDPADDVVRGDGGKEPVHDDLARSLDLLAVSYTRDPDGGYWGHIRLADLTPVASLAAAERHYSAQYAATFSFGDVPDDGRNAFELRADTGGSDYTHPAGAWRCNSHDEAADTWPETIGFVDVGRGILHIKVPDKPAKLLASGSEAHGLSASSWASTAQSSRPQTDDWAQSKVTFKGNDLPVQPAPSGDGLTPCGKGQPQPAGGETGGQGRTGSAAEKSAARPGSDPGQPDASAGLQPAQAARTASAPAGLLLAGLLVALARRRR